MNHLDPIVILCPMECEFSTIAAALEGKSETRLGNYLFLEGTLDGTPVVAIRCLVGMVNSVGATMLAIEKYHPRCVLIQGTAGGHAEDLHQYDIVLGERAVETGKFMSPHRDVGQGSRPEDWKSPGAEMFVDGEVRLTRYLECDPRLLELAEKVAYTRGKVRRGTVATGDWWNRELDRIAFLHANYGTDCEEMEGFAVYQICRQFAVPCLCVRVISNSELYPEEEFDPATAVAAQEFCLDLMRLIGKDRV